MDVRFANAASAYVDAAKRISSAGEATKSQQSDSTASFSDLVSAAARNSFDATKAGEKISIDAVANKADLNEIVTSVANAEVALQTVVAIRDRVIQAYQDIIKMPL